MQICIIKRKRSLLPGGNVVCSQWSHGSLKDPIVIMVNHCSFLQFEDDTIGILGKSGKKSVGWQDAEQGLPKWALRSTSGAMWLHRQFLRMIGSMAFVVEGFLLQPDSIAVGLSRHELRYVEEPFSDGLRVSICLCLIAICWLWFLLLLPGSSFGSVRVCMYTHGGRAGEEQEQHFHLQFTAPQIYRYYPVIVLTELFFRNWHNFLFFHQHN